MSANNNLEDKIIALEKKVDSILKALKDSNEIEINNAAIIDNNFQILNSKIENIDKKVSTLHKDTIVNFDEVKLELVKIQKTTQYDELYANLAVVSK